VSNKENIVSYTSKELKAMIAHDEDKRDMTKANHDMTEEEIAADIAAEGIERIGEWEGGEVWKGLPPLAIFLPKNKTPKVPMTLRVDRDVFDWFKARGPGYQTMINAVLRSFVHAYSSPKARRLASKDAVVDVDRVLNAKPRTPKKTKKKAKR
jgi:uncharacterized protein (DUF4415 family)